MGYTSYNVTARATRASLEGYATKGMDQLFEQNKVKRSHDSMSPMGVKLRECFDSEAHPNSHPVVLGLDFTASMRRIPHELVKTGLPTLMSGLQEIGVEDAALLFLGIGDHKYDSYPIQVGQFESGDEELDLWLTRSYLEGGGGGNGGESYHLAWEFAANRIQADAINKRNQKGTLITIGDEPCHSALQVNVLNEIYGRDAVEGEGYSDLETLLAQVKENWNVYHLNMMGGQHGKTSLPGWQELLGERASTVDSTDDLPAKLIQIISNDVVENGITLDVKKEEKVEDKSEVNVIL